MEKPLLVFCCYARKDHSYLHDMKQHLMALQREQLIEVKADININPGTEWEREISHHLNEAKIILLLISADFIASDYCFEKEMQLAIKRHERGTACVLPVIIRPTSWENMPFSKLQALPKNAKPVSTWRNRDEAWANVTAGIREVVNKFRHSLDETGQRAAIQSSPTNPILDIPELPIHHVDRTTELATHLQMRPTQHRKSTLRQTVLVGLVGLIILALASGIIWLTRSHTPTHQATLAGVITEFALSTSQSNPVGIAAGPDGNLWFTELTANKIGCNFTSGGLEQFSIPTPNSQPDAIAAGPDGALWFTENGGNRIGRITTGN